MITRRHVIAGLAATPFIARPAFADGPKVFVENDVAIRGIDPVSYFRAEGPQDGADRYRLMWRNVIWRFASAENLGAFERDPHRFAPRYGGYCAMSLSRGLVSDTVPDAWTIHQGRLYLTHSLAARDQWRQDPEGHIAKADANWPAALCT